jgi:integrase
MATSRRLKHLPVAEWPAADRALFAVAFAGGDIFDDDRGAGAHLSDGSRRAILFGWRRWLGFLAEHYPEDIALPAAERVTMQRVRNYADNLAGIVSASSVAITIARLYDGARLTCPDSDWSWLKALKTRLQALDVPKDRFERLVPPHETLDLGIALMDAAATPSINGRKEAEIQFRDGLIIALLSLWPIRRHSIAALTLAHVEFGDDRADILLDPEDTKAGRAESWAVPEAILPYLRHYLNEIRTVLIGRHEHHALWVGQRGNALGDGAIYDAVRRRTKLAFGKPMGLHDFRRAAATFLAMDAPENVGLIPGILQHASPDTGDRYYNLARSSAASRRYSATMREIRARLRPIRMGL